MPDCENCNERCPKAEMAHEIALGRMYATNELVKLVKKIESRQLVEVGNCDGCMFANRKRPQKCSCCRRNRYLKDCYCSEAR